MSEKKEDSNSSTIVDIINGIIEKIKKINIKKKFIRNILLTITFVIFFVLFPSIYYLYSFKLFNIVHNFPILTIIATLLIFFSCLFIILINFDTDLVDRHIGFQAIYKAIYNILYIFAIFILFSLFYHISKFIVYNSSAYSVKISFFIITLILALKISYNRESSEQFGDDIDDTKNMLIKLLKDVILLIPCLIVDFMEWMRKYISVLPKTSYVIIVILLLVIVASYILPILKEIIRNSDGITLIKKSQSLDNEVFYMSQNELKDKIIESKPFLRRNLLRKNNDFKLYLDSTKDEIKDLNRSRVIEGFDKTIHLLDKHIEYGVEIEKLNEDEKSLIEQEMESNKLTIDDFESVQKFKEYILSLRQEDKYYELLNKIGEYNNMKNDFIYQEASNLVHLINRTNHIQDYNYHYGLSFWVYFDADIQRIQTKQSKRGVIMNYSNSPKLFYDYSTSELKITIENCENADKRCSENLVYKTKDILFQRWNHFVVNYNYGTLDFFINNNLVLSKDRITPYIKDAFLSFGSNKEKLYNCGICNIKYYDIPLNLTTINDIYRNKNTPCDA